MPDLQNRREATATAAAILAAREFIDAFEAWRVHARICEQQPDCIHCDILWRNVGHWHDIALAADLPKL